MIDRGQFSFPTSVASQARPQGRSSPRASVSARSAALHRPGLFTDAFPHQQPLLRTSRTRGPVTAQRLEAAAADSFFSDVGPAAAGTWAIWARSQNLCRPRCPRSTSGSSHPIHFEGCTSFPTADTSQEVQRDHGSRQQLSVVKRGLQSTAATKCPRKIAVPQTLFPKRGLPHFWKNKGMLGQRVRPCHSR